MVAQPEVDVRIRTLTWPSTAAILPPSTGHLALQLESELDEERRRGREVVDHDAHVLHALDRHALDGSDTTAPLRRPSVADGLVGTRRPLV